MSEEIPVISGRNAMHQDGITQVVFYPGAIYTAFEEWLNEKGLELTPPMVFSDDPLEVPTRFVALTDKSVSEIWADGPANQNVSKLGQEATDG